MHNEVSVRRFERHNSPALHGCNFFKYLFRYFHVLTFILACPILSPAIIAAALPLSALSHKENS